MSNESQASEAAPLPTDPAIKKPATPEAPKPEAPTVRGPTPVGWYYETLPYYGD